MTSDDTIHPRTSVATAGNSLDAARQPGDAGLDSGPRIRAVAGGDTAEQPTPDPGAAAADTAEQPTVDPGHDTGVGVGVPDGFTRIWTPHRLPYIRGEAKPAGDPNDPSVCPFCVAVNQPDDEALVVARGTLVYAVLNLFPYNAGHLLVVPYRHIPDLTDLRADEAAEFMAFTQRAVRVLRVASNPHGFNIGINLGPVAGAGIAAHLHQHIVPRWGGDTNFMPVIGRTRVLPQLLRDTRELLAKTWAETSA